VTATVLVVEDNEALAENIAELFEETGASVTICEILDEAYASAKAKPPDLSIVDVRLPAGQSGLDAIPTLREISPHGEVIIMTGNATLDTAIEAVRRGVFAYVQKPFDPEDLIALGQRALSQVALRRERQALARDLASSEALYRGVVDTVEQLIVGVDADGRIELVNPCATRTTGRSADALSGASFVEVVAVPEEAQRARRILDAARSGVGVREVELTLASATGGTRLVRWTLTPLSVGDSRASVVAVGLDVTERVELERRTAQSEALAAMGALTAGLAHEIRNPLNAAKLQLEMLVRSTAKVSDAAAGDAIRERADVVKGEISRLSKMLDEFLSLARPRGMVSTTFEVLELFEEVRALEQPVAEEARVEIDVAPGDPATVTGDRHKIKQVLVNLVANAVEAIRSTGRGGRITLGVRPRLGSFVEVRVTDDGPGLAPEVARRLFEPFFTTKDAGTGLGLSVVKRIVELHGGRITLDSPPGAGTTATFTLPSS
jgi:PAS domain S-box-containing protein